MRWAPPCGSSRIENIIEWSRPGRIDIVKIDALDS